MPRLRPMRVNAGEVRGVGVRVRVRPVWNAELRRDPTLTTGLRAEYAREATRRFESVAKLVRMAIVDRDVFGLRPGLALLARPKPGNLPRPREFVLPRRGARHEAFMTWLREQEENMVLELVRDPSGRVLAQGEWQHVLVRRGYLKGVQSADTAIKATGGTVPLGEGVVVVTQPIHIEALEILYHRNLMELRGITEAMNQEIGRVLANGLARGRGPEQIARSITRSVKGVGIKRARLMARTEIIRAHADATLTRYEQMGVKDVTAEVEFATAGDNRVCSQCEGLEGLTFTIDQARDLIPVHPQCRCTWLPVV